MGAGLVGESAFGSGAGGANARWEKPTAAVWKGRRNGLERLRERTEAPCITFLLSSGTLAPAASLVLLRGCERMGRTGLGKSMSVELISVLVAVLAIGATLAGLILTSNRGLRQDVRQDMVRLDERIGGLEVRLREDMGKLESRLRDDIKQLGDRVGRVEHSQAKLEGLLEGLREAITGRVKAS